MSGAKKRGKIIALCICFVLLGSFLIFLITCVSFRQTIIPSRVGDCVAIVFFEKEKIRTANKVVLTDSIDEHKVVTITDMNLINQIVKETAVATRANLGCAKSDSRRIDLFCDDQLIRSMKWSCCCENTVNVYDADSTHWILFPAYKHASNKTVNEGWVILSKELEHKLDALLEEALTQKPD